MNTESLTNIKQLAMNHSCSVVEPSLDAFGYTVLVSVVAVEIHSISSPQAKWEFYKILVVTKG